MKKRSQIPKPTLRGRLR